MFPQARTFGNFVFISHRTFRFAQLPEAGNSLPMAGFHDFRECRAHPQAKPTR